MSYKSNRDGFTVMTAQSNLATTFVPVLVGATILLTIASSSEILPTRTGDVIAVLCYSILLITVIHGYDDLTLPRLPFFVFVLLYAIFIVNSLRIFTGQLVISSSYVPLGDLGFQVMYLSTLGANILGSFVTIFIVPTIVSRDWLFNFLALVSTCTVLVGLPAYVIGDFQVGWIIIKTYTSLDPLREFGVFVPALASYFGDANALSKIALAGSFASLHQYLRYSVPRTKVMLSVNTLGLFLGNSRSAMIAVGVFLSIYIIYVKFGKGALRAYFIVLGMFGIIGFLSLVILPVSVPVLSNINFSGRVALWQGTIPAIVQNPLLGAGVFKPAEIVMAYTSIQALGLPPQNSYLRVFIMAGSVGGFAYFGLMCLLVLRYVSFIKSRLNIVMLGFFIAMLIIQMTDTAVPFGVNKNSMISGFTLGYLIKDIYYN